MNRYQWYFQNIASRDLMYKLQFQNINQIPKIEGISLNISTKESILDRKRLLPYIAGLQIISGQKLKRTYAKKSIAGFKLRSGQLLGAAGNLRRHKMYSFLDKLVTIVLPKIRDFQGISSPNSQIGYEVVGKAQYEQTITTDILQKMKVESLNLQGASFLLYPELENHYELFESIPGFNITIRSPILLLAFVLPTKSSR